jgi:hypothetical protein
VSLPVRCQEPHLIPAYTSRFGHRLCPCKEVLAAAALPSNCTVRPLKEPICC